MRHFPAFCAAIDSPCRLPRSVVLQRMPAARWPVGAVFVFMSSFQPRCKRISGPIGPVCLPPEVPRQVAPSVLVCVSVCVPVCAGRGLQSGTVQSSQGTLSALRLFVPRTGAARSSDACRTAAAARRTALVLPSAEGFWD